MYSLPIDIAYIRKIISLEDGSANMGWVLELGKKRELRGCELFGVQYIFLIHPFSRIYYVACY